MFLSPRFPDRYLFGRNTFELLKCLVDDHSTVINTSFRQVLGRISYRFSEFDSRSHRMEFRFYDFFSRRLFVTTEMLLSAIAGRCQDWT